MTLSESSIAPPRSTSLDAYEENTNAAPTNMIETFDNFIHNSFYVESKSNRQQYDFWLVKKFRRGNRWTRQVTKKIVTLSRILSHTNSSLGFMFMGMNMKSGPKSKRRSRNSGY
jgi:hypothetical protein